MGRDKRGPSRKWLSNRFAIVFERSSLAVRAPCAHQRLANASHKAKRFQKRAGHRRGLRKTLRFAPPFHSSRRLICLLFLHHVTFRFYANILSVFTHPYLPVLQWFGIMLVLLRKLAL